MKNIQDYYFKKAKKENYKARSVYKLEEAQKKFNFIKPSDLVLDIGCSPGSFSQYMLGKILRSGKVVGVDIIPTTFSHKRFTFIEGDIKTMDIEMFEGVKFDVIVSDAMPNTTSDKETNHLRSVSLASYIFNLSKEVLKEDGNFFIKVFEGRDLPDLKNDVSCYFEKVSIFKPKSSRDESREIFLFACKFVNMKKD